MYFNSYLTHEVALKIPLKLSTSTYLTHKMEDAYADKCFRERYNCHTFVFIR